jgi:signal transduction histidine kinase
MKSVTDHFTEPLRKVWLSKDGVNGLSREEIPPVIEAINTFLERFKATCDSETQLKMLLLLAEGSYRLGDYNQAVYYFESIRSLAESKHILYYKIKAVNGIAVNHMVHGEFLQGIDLWEDLAPQIVDLQQRADGFNNLGIAYSMLDQYQKALESHYSSLRIDEELGLEKEIGTNYLNLANTYWRLQQYDKCLELYLKATEIFEKHKSYRYLSSSYGNISRVYTELQDYEKALAYANQSLELKTQYSNDLETALTLTSLGNIHSQLKNYSKALEYHNTALETYIKNKDQYSIAYSSLDIGWTYFEMEDLKKAYKFAKDSLKLAEEINNPTVIMGNYQLLSSIFKKQKKYKNALEFHEKYFETYKKLFHENPKLMVAQSEVDYYRRKTEQHAESYRLSNIELSRKNKIVSQKSQQLNKANQLLQNNVTFLSRLVSVIAHDIRGPISSVSQAIKMIREKQFTDADEKELLTQISISTDNSVSIINDILFWIRHSQPKQRLPLEPVDAYPLLLQAVSLYRNMAKLKGIRIIVPPKQYTPVLAETSFLKMVFRNLLHNALKFSPNESQINLLVRFEGKYTVFDFCDEGCGLSNAKITEILAGNYQANSQESNDITTGFGIGLCMEYLSQMKGKLSISSELDKGSTISAKLLTHTTP